MFLAINPTGHSRSKNTDIWRHFVQEQLAQKVISLGYILANNMPANGLTKALLKNLFTRFKKHLGLTKLTFTTI